MKNSRELSSVDSMIYLRNIDVRRAVCKKCWIATGRVTSAPVELVI